MWHRSAHLQQHARVQLRNACVPWRLRGDDRKEAPIKTSRIAFTHHQIGIRMISS
jgi:hypothetical protein